MINIIDTPKEVYELENLFKEKGFLTSLHREWKILDVELFFGTNKSFYKLSISYESVVQSAFSTKEQYNNIVCNLLGMVKNFLLEKTDDKND